MFVILCFKKILAINMAFSLLWSLGLILSIIIFAIDLGLLFNFKDISKSSLVKYSVIFFVGTLILIYFIDLFKSQFLSFLGLYNYLLLFLISFVLMFIGYLINKNDNFKKDFRLIVILSYLCFILMAFMCILSKQALFGLNSFQISLLTAILFTVLVVVFRFALAKLDLINSYKAFGSLYFILGAYCLIVSLFLPNIISLDINEMSPINIVSIESMILTIVLLIIVAVCGLFYYRKNSNFK